MGFLDWLKGKTEAVPEPELGVQSWERLSDGDFVILLSDGKAYRGSCTVWRSVDDATRPPYWVADELTRYWKLVSWGMLAEKKRPGLWSDICAGALILGKMSLAEGGSAWG